MKKPGSNHRGASITRLGPAIAPRHARLLVWASVAVVTIVALLAIWIHLRLANLVEAHVANSLQVTLDAAVEGVQLATDDARRVAESVLNDVAMIDALRACASEGRCQDIASQLASSMHAGGFSSFLLLDGSGGVAAASGATSADPALGARMTQGAADGVRVLPPRAGRDASLYVVAPLRTADGPRFGTLVYGLPFATIDRVLRAARAGRSGETYAFDAQARMVSESRFAGALATMGLAADGEGSAGIALRNPGRDLRAAPLRAPPAKDRPLTHMAATAVNGQAGLRLEPYRDYRGVPVVGAWRFVPALGLGFATEVDAQEVYGTLRDVRDLLTRLVTALGVLCVGILAAVAYAAYLSRVLARSQRR